MTNCCNCKIILIFNNVYINKDGKDVCIECLENEVQNDFTYGIDYILEDIDVKFNKSYEEYWKWLLETHIICSNCNTWTHNDLFIDGLNVCQNCFERVK